MMDSVKVGVQLYPQHSTYPQLVDTWRQADELGVDSIWTWDHFFPITDDGSGEHFEGWSLLAAQALLTAAPHIGVLVTSAAYRNPNMLADMARTIDHMSDGRVVIGIGAGWFQRDYADYGFEMRAPADRLRQLEDAVTTIRMRIPQLQPPPVGSLPILIGGSGERITLRIVAQHADWWNTFGPVEQWAAKNRLLDDWCERVGRDPADVVRTALIQTEDDWQRADQFVAAGASHLIVGLPAPYDLDAVARVQQVVAGR